jgi:hypothetical protein
MVVSAWDLEEKANRLIALDHPQKLSEARSGVVDVAGTSCRWRYQYIIMMFMLYQLATDPYL